MRALKQLIGHPTPKNLDEIIRESIKLRDPFQHFSTVIISDHNIIKGITQSKPNNLILDNFGKLFAEMFTAVSTDQDEITLKDILNANKTVQFYGDGSAGDNSFAHNTAALGTLVQVGAGTTPAARDDYAIETPFIVAPEDDIFETGPGSYALGSIAVAGAISAGGAGTINETILVMKLADTGLSGEDIAFFHDILVSGEAFIAAQTITVAYTINL